MGGDGDAEVECVEDYVGLSEGVGALVDNRGQRLHHHLVQACLLSKALECHLALEERTECGEANLLLLVVVRAEQVAPCVECAKLELSQA